MRLPSSTGNELARRPSHLMRHDHCERGDLDVHQGDAIGAASILANEDRRSSMISIDRSTAGPTSRSEMVMGW